MPSSKESALLRRKNDERVELLGTACKLYRHKDIAGGGVQYDEFDRPVVIGNKPRAVFTTAIIEPYQEEMQRVYDEKGRVHERFPYVGTFRFLDDVRRLDIVEVAYEYARAAGLTHCLFGEVTEPSNI